MNRTFVTLRYPIFASALVGLVTGIWAGLIRIGWWFPFSDHIPLEAHGPLMVSGFLGIVIGLERAVGLNQKWNYLAPALTGIGVLGVIVGLPLPLPRLLITLGSLVFVLIALRIVQIRRAMFTVTMALGAMALYIGNMLWMLDYPMFNSVYWWGAFLILTIAGERLELARIVQVSKVGRSLFTVAVAILCTGLITVSFDPETGVVLTGASMAGIGLWLLRYDMARRTVRTTGLPRFSATNLLIGYVWLCVSGSLAVWSGAVDSGPQFDAILHSLFLGFVFSMIFGHAPMIFPSLLQVPMLFHWSFYSHVVLLHGTLLLRVGGDLSGWFSGRSLGGLMNAAVLALFFVNTAISVARGKRARKTTSQKV